MDGNDAEAVRTDVIKIVSLSLRFTEENKEAGDGGEERRTLQTSRAGAGRTRERER